MPTLLISSPILLSAHPWFHDLHDAPLRAGSGLPFPTVKRMYSPQSEAFARAKRLAQTASKAATAELLSHLNGSDFRRALAVCCNQSGVASWPASELLDALRGIYNVAELVHNFDGADTFETDNTIEISLYNATEYFPSTWQLRYLKYYGDDRFNPAWGYPKSPEGVAEEGCYGLPPFHGPHDEPLTYEGASSRLLYIALNMLRVDVGNPGFGNVTAVFAPSFTEDAVIASPLDTGLYTMFCNETYRHAPGHFTPHWHGAPIACGRGQVNPPGVRGHIDHILLNNQRFWSNGPDTLVQVFARTYGDTAAAESLLNVSHTDLERYIEPNIVANALYAEGAVKLLVGAFAPLFGTARGSLLQRWAKSRGVVLTWAIAAANGGATQRGTNVTFRGDVRVIDVPSSGHLVNASMTQQDAAAFSSLWEGVAGARDPTSGAISESTAWMLWARARHELSLGLQVELPRVGDCADNQRCLGRGKLGQCVCYLSR